ncbi:hypothetical protein BX616_002205 [Lobosporangium transversale]|nr:hypothetical protein BX616_002205 [Lobosporangium transversale]
MSPAQCSIASEGVATKAYFTGRRRSLSVDAICNRQGKILESKTTPSSAEKLRLCKSLAYIRSYMLEARCPDYTPCQCKPPQSPVSAMRSPTDLITSLATSAPTLFIPPIHPPQIPSTLSLTMEASLPSCVTTHGSGDQSAPLPAKNGCLTLTQFEKCMEVCFEHIHRWQNLSSARKDTSLCEPYDIPARHPKVTRWRAAPRSRPRSRSQAAASLPLSSEKELRANYDQGHVMPPQSHSESLELPRKCTRARSNPHPQTTRMEHTYLSCDRNKRPYVNRDKKDTTKNAFSMETLLDVLALIISRAPDEWAPGSVLTEYFKQSYGQGQSIQQLLDQLPSKDSQTIMFLILKVSKAWIDTSALLSLPSLAPSPSITPPSSKIEQLDSQVKSTLPRPQRDDDECLSERFEAELKDAQSATRSVLVEKLAVHVFLRRIGSKDIIDIANPLDRGNHTTNVSSSNGRPKHRSSNANLSISGLVPTGEVNPNPNVCGHVHDLRKADAAVGCESESKLDASIALNNLLSAYESFDQGELKPSAGTLPDIVSHETLSMPVNVGQGKESLGDIGTMNPNGTPSLSLPPWRTKLIRGTNVKRLRSESFTTLTPELRGSTGKVFVAKSTDKGFECNLVEGLKEELQTQSHDTHSKECVSAVVPSHCMQRQLEPEREIGTDDQERRAGLKSPLPTRSVPHLVSAILSVPGITLSGNDTEQQPCHPFDIHSSPQQHCSWSTKGIVPHTLKNNGPYQHHAEPVPLQVKGYTTDVQADGTEYNYKSSYWQYRSRKQARQSLESKGSITGPFGHTNASAVARRPVIAQKALRSNVGLTSAWKALTTLSLTRNGDGRTERAAASAITTATSLPFWRSSLQSKDKMQSEDTISIPPRAESPKLPNNTKQYNADIPGQPLAPPYTISTTDQIAKNILLDSFISLPSPKEYSGRRSSLFNLNAAVDENDANSKMSATLPMVATPSIIMPFAQTPDIISGTVMDPLTSDEPSNFNPPSPSPAAAGMGLMSGSNPVECQLARKSSRLLRDVNSQQPLKRKASNLGDDFRAGPSVPGFTFAAMPPEVGRVSVSMPITVPRPTASDRASTQYRHKHSKSQDHFLIPRNGFQDIIIDDSNNYYDNHSHNNNNECKPSTIASIASSFSRSAGVQDQMLQSPMAWDPITSLAASSLPLSRDISSCASTASVQETTPVIVRRKRSIHEKLFGKLGYKKPTSSPVSLATMTLTTPMATTAVTTLTMPSSSIGSSSMPKETSTVETLHTMPSYGSGANTGSDSTTMVSSMPSLPSPTFFDDRSCKKQSAQRRYDWSLGSKDCHRQQQLSDAYNHSGNVSIQQSRLRSVSPQQPPSSPPPWSLSRIRAHIQQQQSSQTAQASESLQQQHSHLKPQNEKRVRRQRQEEVRKRLFFKAMMNDDICHMDHPYTHLENENSTSHKQESKHENLSDGINSSGGSGGSGTESGDYHHIGGIYGEGSEDNVPVKGRYLGENARAERDMDIWKVLEQWQAWRIAHEE